MVQPDRELNGYWVVALAMPLLLAIAGWSYWPVIMDLFAIWQGNEDYSAGQLVPLVVAFLIWRERKAITQPSMVPFWAGGIALLLLGEVGRTYGFLSMRPAAGHYALVLTVMGLVLMVMGWRVFRRILWILLFLFLMVPLPGSIQTTVSGPLQSVATTGAVFLLEVFRVSVTRQGNVIALHGGPSLEVAKACSGLRMLMAFLIVAAFIAYMVRRPRWQKSVLFLSSIPVAVICNIVRIFVTALLVRHVGEDAAQKFFHDFAGFVMMPIAVILLFGEIWVLDRITVPEPEGSLPGSAHASAQVIVAKRAPSQCTHQPV
jgi:exosortase